MADLFTQEQYQAFVQRAIRDPEVPVCVVCRRRHRLPTDPAQKRPKWAKGKAFVGWEWNPRDETIFRTTAAAFLAIDEEGVLTIDPYSDYSDNRNLIELGCPENALTMADAYATVSGGWFDPKEEGGVEK